jgi:RHS repeat-associated protein
MKVKSMRRILFMLLAIAVMRDAAIAQNNVKPNIKVPNGFEVNSFSGNLYHQRNDMKMPALGIPMEIVFSFNNTRRIRNWGMGPGWTFTYNMAYTPDSLGIYIERADGRRDLYRKSGSSYVAPPGVFDVLSEYQPGKLRLVAKEGTSYFFDNASHKKLTQVVSSNNNSQTISYTDSFPTAISDEAGRSLSLTWQNKRLVKIQNNCSSPAHVIQYSYDTAGNPVKVINPVGDTIYYYYDRNSRIIGYTDGNGYSMSFSYNANGTIEKIISCVTTHLFSYTPLLNKTFVTELSQGQRLVTTYNYDSTGRIIHKEGNCCGYDMSYQYDAANNIVLQTNGNNQSTKYQYDSKGNVIKEIDALGNSISYTWHSTLNKISQVTDKRNNTTSYEYDANGNQKKIIRPLNVVESFEYDARGNMLSYTDGNGNTTAYEYNNFGQITKITDAANGVVQNTYDGCGILLQAKDARNNITKYEHDALGRLKKVTNALGEATHYTYDAYGNITSVKDALGRLTAYLYDGLGRRVATTTPAGITITEEYDERGNRIKFTDGKGNSTRYTYNSRNQVLSETDALGHSVMNEYDKAGNLITAIDKRKNATRYQYDAMNRLVKITNATGAVSTFTYDATGNRISATDFNGNASFSEYDALNRLTKVTDALNKSITYAYDSNSNMVSQKDRNGNLWVVRYDKLNREVKSFNPLGYFTETGYDANGNRTSVKDQNGHVAAYAYDALNRLEKEINPLNETTGYTYDSVGNIKTVSHPNGNRVTYTYDADNRLILEQDIIGVLNSYAYDGNGNRVSEKDGNNNTVLYNYDPLNRVMKIIDALGSFSTTKYDATGNIITQIDRNGNSKSYEYDKMNRRIVEADALGYSTRFEYDGNNNRTRIVDANNNITSYTFDALNRLLRETYADGTYKEYTYDGNGNRKTRRDNRGIVTNYTYNSANKLLQRSYPGGINEIFSYDKIGRPLTANNSNATVTFTYDAAGRVLTETLNGKTTAYSYSATSRTLTYPGGKVIKETTDDRHRLSSVTEGSSNIAVFTYDGGNRIVSKTLGNGVAQNYSYDENNRLIEMNCQPNNILQFRYSYDKEGNKLTSLKSHRPLYSEKYEYNNLYQLTGFYTGKLIGNSFFDTTSKSKYLYDMVHNRVTSMEDTLNRVYTVNNTNAYTQIANNGSIHNYTYDLNGNNTSDGNSTYQYDYDNRLISINGLINYKYDALGRRIQTMQAGKTISHYYSANRVVEETIMDVISTKKDYVYGAWIDDLIGYEYDNNKVYVANDGQGSVLAVFRNNETEYYEYKAFGIANLFDKNYQPIPTSLFSNDVLFSGRTVTMPGNIYHLRNRDMDSRNGRFLQKDPLGYLDGYNDYAYVNNRPSFFIDPFGLAGSDTHGTIKCFFWDDCPTLIEKIYKWRKHLVQRVIELEQDERNLKVTDITKYNNHVDKAWEAHYNLENCYRLLENNDDCKNQCDKEGGNKLPMRQIGINIPTRINDPISSSEFATIEQFKDWVKDNPGLVAAGSVVVIAGAVYVVGPTVIIGAAVTVSRIAISHLIRRMLVAY